MSEILLAYLAIGVAVAIAREQWTIGRFLRTWIAWPIVAWTERGQIAQAPVVRRLPDTWETRIATAIASLRTAIARAPDVPDLAAARKTLGGANRGLRQLAARRAELAELLARPDHDRTRVIHQIEAAETSNRKIWEHRLAHIDALGTALGETQEQLERGLSQVLNLSARLHLGAARRKAVNQLAAHLTALDEQVAVMEELTALETGENPPPAALRLNLDVPVPSLPPMVTEPIAASTQLPALPPRMQMAPSPFAATGLDPASYRGARLAMAAGIMGCAAASMFYRAVAMHGLKETSALFIGFPAVIALAIALLPPAKSFTGLLLKVTTLGILMSGVILGEGMICVLMAAPIMYLVATASGILLDVLTKRSTRTTTRVAVLLPWLPLSLEGTPIGWEMDRAETVTVEQVVERTEAQVEQAWRSRPSLDGPLPVFLTLGFPVPVGAAGSGLEVGDRRLIHFAGGEGDPGTLVLEVTDRFSDGVRFKSLSDTSHIGHWLTWETVDVKWEPVDADHTRVTWTAQFERRLDPGLYFGPVTRFGVAQAGAALIEQIGGTHVD